MNKKNRLKKKWLKKYRFVIMNDSTFEENFSLKLSRMNIFVLFSSISFFLIIITVIIIAFTSLREYIPGYSNIEDRQKLYNLSIKADKLDDMTYIFSSYIDSLFLILSGTENVSKIDYENIKKYSEKETSANNPNFGISSSKSIYESLFYYNPIEGVLVQKFSPAMNHLGIDIATENESPVMAVRNGTVILAHWNYEFGNIIVIQHENNIISVYKHNYFLLKKEGDKVKGGEVIALSGNTGENSTGPHLHFELWINGTPVNPESFLNY